MMCWNGNEKCRACSKVSSAPSVGYSGTAAGPRTRMKLEAVKKLERLLASS
jgi:hypothetical protein